MSQKELAYIEDIYNHELLIIKYLDEMVELIGDKTYISMFESQSNTHKNLIKKLDKLMEDYYE